METLSLAPLMDPASAPAETIRVWLVEDDAGYRQTMVFLLDHTAGMRCARAFDRAEAALEVLAGLAPAERPHVVLLDVHLPGISGLDAIAALKAGLPGARVVMITIRDDAGTIFRAFRNGASGYLLKDTSVDGIIAAVREAHSGGLLMPAPVARKVLRLLSETPPAPPDYGLTEREREILQQMVEGLTQQQIADRLFISRPTVSTHIQHIYDKLHVRSASAAVAKAVREQLI